MIISLTTTAKEVVAPDSNDRIIKFSAGNFASSAASVYIRKVNSKNPWLILNGVGKSSDQLTVPHGTQLEAYTDAGTADLVVLKACCTASY